jgi:hypothetical protein
MRIYVESEEPLNRQEIIDAASEKAVLDDKAKDCEVEDWTCMEQFNQGNVCYCPSPWEVEVEDEDGNEIEDES